jgi:coenzyme F420 hydrogenase subunit delta
MHNDTKKHVTVYGCGNILLGDDGFGPAVIEELQKKDDLPPTVLLEDVGTGIREYLFDFILAPDTAPSQLIVLDAVDFEHRAAGEVFTITPDAIPAKKIHDFSLHQFPTVNLLQELAEHLGIAVHIIAAQIQYIPDEIQPGLTPTMQDAVKLAGSQVRQLVANISVPPSKEENA